MNDNDLENIIEELMVNCNNIYINENEHYRAKIETETRDARFSKWLLNKYSNKNKERSNPILQRLRSVKDPIETKLIQQACDITEKGFRRILNFIKPGVMEYEIEAEFIHEFLKNRSKGFAYTPIIASGNNANVLHYIENNQQCKAGDLVLIDAGCEYQNYAADITRTFPVNGKFSDEQAAIYDIVLQAQTDAIAVIGPGIEYNKTNEAIL